MSNSNTSIGRFYEGWQVYNERTVEVVGELSAEELGLRPAPEPESKAVPVQSSRFPLMS